MKKLIFALIMLSYPILAMEEEFTIVSPDEERGEAVEVRFGQRIIAKQISPVFLAKEISLYGESRLLNAKEIVMLIQKGYQLLANILTIEGFAENPREFIQKNPEVFTSEKLYENCGYIEGTTKIVSSGYAQVKNLCSWAWRTAPTEQRAQIGTIERRAWLEDIIAILYALTNEAYLQGHTMETGSFILTGEGGKVVYDFIMAYALEAQGIDNPEEMSRGGFAVFNVFGAGKANFAYNRNPDESIPLSSHFRKKTIAQYGLDALFESNAPHALPVFPMKAEHLIFGRVFTPQDKPVTFLKFEPHGLGNVSSLVSHTTGYFTGPLGQGHSEKAIPEQVLVSFLNAISTLDREELQNLGELERFKSLWAKYKNKEKITSSNMPISEMAKILAQADELGYLQFAQKQYENFKKTLSKYHSDEGLELRSGNEIILNIVDLFKGR